MTTTLAIFCKVVDNYGDIGICWRLARQLRREHGVDVTLWVDHLPSFQRLCPQVDVSAERQSVEGVDVRHWRGMDGAFAPADVVDIVIEFFAVDIPPAYAEAMAQRTPKPVWLNLEGLTAEDWVDGCHALPSMHPRLPITKYFFFPGFTPKTGGLQREANLLAERDAFTGRAAFLASLGVTPQEMEATVVSLFCYPHAPIAALMDAWEKGASPVTCLVPQGVAEGVVNPGTRGALTVRVIPFVPQPDYDKLLWSCDFNFVRGEDSWVRAIWSGKPFIWHIYPQDENLHHKKLRAFLAMYGKDSVANLSLYWNGAQEGDAAALWSAFASDPGAETDFEARMLKNGDLAANLLAFARSRA